MTREKASDFDQRLLDLYDDYAHGRVDRRDFMQRAAAFAAAGMSAEAILSRLSPNYAYAQQVAKDDPRIKTEKITYDSPKAVARSAACKLALPQPVANCQPCW